MLSIDEREVGEAIAAGGCTKTLLCQPRNLVALLRELATQLGNFITLPRHPLRVRALSHEAPEGPAGDEDCPKEGNRPWIDPPHHRGLSFAFTACEYAHAFRRSRCPRRRSSGDPFPTTPAKRASAEEYSRSDW